MNVMTGPVCPSAAAVCTSLHGPAAAAAATDYALRPHISAHCAQLIDVLITIIELLYENYLITV